MYFNYHFVISVFTTGNPVKARPSKIVAGLEVNRTNEFLQMIGIAILKKVMIMYIHPSIILFTHLSMN